MQGSYFLLKVNLLIRCGGVVASLSTLLIYLLKVRLLIRCVSGGPLLL